MLNALFVLIVFLLQLNKDLLHFKWPFGVKVNITYDETSQEVILIKNNPRDWFSRRILADESPDKELMKKCVIIIYLKHERLNEI